MISKANDDFNFEENPPRGGFSERPVGIAGGNRESLEELFPSPGACQSWVERWLQRMEQQDATKTTASLRATNPLYIPRNHLVEDALAAATDQDDLSLFERLLDVVSLPCKERKGLEDYARPAPKEFTACYKTFCGT